MNRLAFIVFLFALCTVQAKSTVFAIEGNAGAGKTTLLNALSERMPELVIIPEPIDMVQNCDGIDLFAMLFSDMSRWAFTICTKYHLAHIQRVHDTIIEHPNCIFITDHSGFDVYYAFVQMYKKLGHITPVEAHVYDQIFNLTLDKMIVPKGFIYLQIDPAVACKRVCMRDRLAEQEAPAQFWFDLHEAFEDMLIGRKHEMGAIKNVPVLIIDANVDMHEHPEYVKESTERIISFITKHT